MALVATLVATLLGVPGAAPAHAAATAPSDPGARLVFTRACDVWIAHPSGTDLTNLTADVELCAIQPSISRTGRYVAFAIGAGSWSEVWIHDRRSGSATNLAAALGGGQVEFSPTADTLAFTRFDPAAGTANIYSVGVDGSGLKQWTFDAEDGAVNILPSWSPDGSSILHSTTRGSWSCGLDWGGYVEQVQAYRLARVSADGALTEVAGSDDFSILGAGEGGGVLAYVRQPMPSGPSGGSCAFQPGVEGELIINAQSLGAAVLSRPSVSPNGDVSYERADGIVVLAADSLEPVATFPGSSADWGVDHAGGSGSGGGSGGGGGGPDGDPPSRVAPIARCDVYWTRPGTRLTVSAAKGLLANDVDPRGLALRPAVEQISFRKRTHPYTVAHSGSLTIQTLPTDRRLVLGYRAVSSDGTTSASTTVMILVSPTKPSASALKPCPAADVSTSRGVRGADSRAKKRPPVAFPANTAKNRDLLAESMRSWSAWQHMLENKTRAPYRSMDFVHDSCSAPGNAGNSWLITFTSYCIRHDFAYRNGLWLDRFNEIRLQADRNFLSDLLRHCQRYGPIKRALCGDQALAFYASVRKGGGFAAPSERRSYGDSGSVLIVTVFNPIDNFYVRGWVRDDRADGFNVRLQANAAVSGNNPEPRTIARTRNGGGTRVAFDVSNGGYQNLKGVYFRICVDSDRPDAAECGKRFYVNKPD